MSTYLFISTGEGRLGMWVNSTTNCIFSCNVWFWGRKRVLLPGAVATHYSVKSSCWSQDITWLLFGMKNLVSLWAAVLAKIVVPGVGAMEGIAETPSLLESVEVVLKSFLTSWKSPCDCQYSTLCRHHHIWLLNVWVLE